MSSDLQFYLIAIICVSLIFDFINGFHDAANSVATIVSTNVLKPGTAVILAAVCNFIAMLIFTPRVAETISQIVIFQPGNIVYLDVLFAGLIGAIFWDLLTWLLGLPTSSSHALIGGVAGAGIAHGGWEALHWDIILKTLEFIIIAPCLGAYLAYVFMFISLWICRKYQRLTVDRFFRKGQLFTAALYSLGHGGNDAQKTMGIIFALLVAAGYLDNSATLSLGNLQTAWIIVACHTAISLGTAFGGWRIIKTMGMKITKLKPISGFCAESAGAFTLFLSTFGGIPVSTTHTITGAIIGAGSALNGYSRVKWGMAYRILISWFITIPFSGAVAALCYYVSRFFF
jgi:PiT family inorganic phosphate transporter